MSRSFSDVPPNSSAHPAADERLRFTVSEQAKAIATLTRTNAELVATNALQAERIERKSRKVRRLSKELGKMTAAVEQLRTALDEQRVQPDILVSPASSRDRTPLDLGKNPLPQLKSDTPLQGEETSGHRPFTREGAPSFFRSRLNEAMGVIPRPKSVVSTALPARSESCDTPRPFGIWGNPNGRDTTQSGLPPLEAQQGTVPSLQKR